MIDRRHLKDGMKTALAFANGTAPNDEKRKTITIPYFSFGMEPQRVDAGSPQLWKEWRAWLGKFRQPKRRLENWAGLRDWCIARGTGHVGFFEQPEIPFSFDAQGAPQAHLYPKSLQGLLAVVGAELIAPDSPFKVVKCARPGCEKLIMKILVRHRSDGRPTEYCVLPNGKSHALTASERQVKWKKEEAKRLARLKRKAK
jgi:hypothetical protein